MFNAPIYFEDTVTSTQDVSRKLAAKGTPHGTVVVAEFQEKGRGRGSDQGSRRSWHTDRGKSLSFTIMLRYLCMEEIPVALTLRAGLAVTQAIEKFEPSLKGRVKIKWPNDILIRGQGSGDRGQENPAYKKAAGILCEADEGTVHVGIGINVTQKEFPAELQNKATSISLAASIEINPDKRLDLLKIILTNLYNELERNDWKTRIEVKLFKKDEQVTFIEGAADSGNEIKGLLTGISDNGEIIIDNQAYITGELKF